MNENSPQPTSDEEEILRIVAAGVTKVRDNAEQLFSEAKLLRAAGALSRALFLHQISMEECAKADMLGASAISRLSGTAPDKKKFSKALSSHKAKNFANAYMLKPNDEEKRARAAGDWRAAIAAFDESKAAFHHRANTAKNAALYVDVQGDVFSAPSDCITEDMVEEIAKRNQEFLARANTYVRVLTRWQQSAAEFAEISRWLVERAEQLRSERPDAVDEVLSSLLAEAFGKLSSMPRNEPLSEVSSTSADQAKGPEIRSQEP